MRIRTESGSVYEFDLSNHSWARLEEGQDKSYAPLRSTEGHYIDIGPIVVGKRVNLVCPPYVEGASFRYITTSPVVEIL